MCQAAPRRKNGEKGQREGAGQKLEIVTNEHMNRFLRLIADLLIERLNLRRAKINQGLFTLAGYLEQASRMNQLSRMLTGFESRDRSCA